jgi:hypothetical protein
MTLLRIFLALLGIAVVAGLFLLVLAMSGVIGDPLVWQR